MAVHGAAVGNLTMSLRDKVQLLDNRNRWASFG